MRAACCLDLERQSYYITICCYALAALWLHSGCLYPLPFGYTSL
jgi:hypothetical protein